MSPVGEPERVTQDRVVRLFREGLGYRYLGDRRDRQDNSNIEEAILDPWLEARGHSDAEIQKALDKLRREADNPTRSLYENNRAVYGLLRYGVQVKVDVAAPTATVHLIDWADPSRNDFAIAEEVTLKGGHERRPDLVLYVNGLALGVIELKNSRTSIGDGIRQLLSNQQPEFNERFFSTAQMLFAGSDAEGLRYGAIGTPEKYFLRWKENEADDAGSKLDKYLRLLCSKERFLELIHDFVLFDGGVKKLPRPHQYFGIKAAQRHARERKGGIIWHTQGSGKSIVMVLLAKWILENNANARVAIVTDRDELDKQINGVFATAGEAIHRTSSGRDLVAQLGQPRPRLLCSLIQKFGTRGVKDAEAFIAELGIKPPTAVGELFIFVDECHRTQSGKLHKAMKAILPNAVFIGFTGTPLLKDDKETSLEVFGGYIHTYKFNEGVEDGIVLDLVYEARDIDQRLGSPDKIDAWFEAKTRGLNDWKKKELKKRWGTLQQVLSSRARMDRIVADIEFDFGTKPRLSSGRGNAIIVASSILDACRYFERFQATPLRDKCAIVTSYDPSAGDVTREETGAGTETDRQKIYNIYTELLESVAASPGKSRTEVYEEWAKKQFKESPASMRLLIVVDKLLTGFDAPPCTFLYIDKSMQDHGLFQAICRTNRLDGDDKTFGYIVDYKDLFKRVEKAIAVYTSELDTSDGGADPQVMVQDRLTKGREMLNDSLEAVALLCEPVEPPRGDLEHIRYFCGNTDIPSDLSDREPLRNSLYKAVAAMLRAHADIADDLEAAGYSKTDIARIDRDRDRFLKVREVVRQASGESLDLKAYEADMRHLIDTYIEADPSRVISNFGDRGLLDIIVNGGIAAAIATRLGALKGNDTAVAEAIENNVRTTIVKEQFADPEFFSRMSELLAEVVAARKAKAIEYEEYLRRIADIARQVDAGRADATPARLHTRARVALYHNLGKNELLAIQVDEAVLRERPDGWRGVPAKENLLKRALLGILNDEREVERIFAIIKEQREY
jgi:type I restriction enzyme R subunit